MVVLPAPLVPTSATTSPGCTSRTEVFQYRLVRPIAEGDVFELEVPPNLGLGNISKDLVGLGGGCPAPRISSEPPPGLCAPGSWPCSGP